MEGFKVVQNVAPVLKRVGKNPCGCDPVGCICTPKPPTQAEIEKNELEELRAFKAKVEADKAPEAAPEVVQEEEATAKAAVAPVVPVVPVVPAVSAPVPVEPVLAGELPNPVAPVATTPEGTQLDKLKKECDEKGISYHHAAGIPKLTALLKEKATETPVTEPQA